MGQKSSKLKNGSKSKSRRARRELQDNASQSSSNQGTNRELAPSSSSQGQTDVVTQPIPIPESTDVKMLVDVNQEVPRPQNIQIGDENITTEGTVLIKPLIVNQTRYLVMQQRNSFPLDAVINTSTSPTSSQENNSYRISGYDNYSDPMGIELQTSLKEKVEEIASTESSLAEFSQRPIVPVNLSIASQPHSVDDQFKANRREELAKMYERPDCDITADQLFVRAKITAQRDADRKFSRDQDNAKQNYVKKHGNSVGVVGQAGIGKTTLSKKWALQASQMYGPISFFFYIVVKFINFNREMSLLEFLLHTILPEWDYTCDEIVFAITSIILADKNVVMFFDGLDEAVFTQASAKLPIWSLHSKFKPEVYLKLLAGGSLLPQARKIFTSRPALLYSLQHSSRPKFVVEIQGLTPQSQEELGRQICGSEYERIHALTRNSNLFAYCYVPVNYILTVHYLINHTGDIQKISLTQILTSSCVSYSQTEHLKKPFRTLDKLTKMAWDGFREQRVLFDTRDFSSAGLDDATADSFLNISITLRGSLRLNILDGQKKKYFSHLIWQEFFAAIYLMMIMPLEEFRKEHTRLTADRWEVVAKFAFGLCDSTIARETEVLFPSCLSSELNQKVQLLKHLDFCRNDQGKESILRLSSCAHEANDAELASALSIHLPNTINFTNTHLSLAVVEDLSFTLKAQRHTKMTRLQLNGTTLGDAEAESLSHCFHNFEEVYMSHCGVGHRGLESISASIQDLQKPLAVLDLSGNQLGDTGAAVVAQSIHNLCDVDLSCCKIGPQGMQQLSQKIKNLPKSLKKVCLSYNKFGNAGAESMAECIHNVESLLLNGCNIEYHGAQRVFQAVYRLTKPMWFLDLSGNNLTSECTHSFIACGPNIQCASYENCGFSTKEKERIKSSLRGLIY